jgi:hypothetical protein
MDNLLPSEVKDIKSQVQEVVVVFSKELLRALCALVILDAKKTIEHTELKRARKQKKLAAKQPRKERKKKPKQIPAKSGFKCTITGWKENKLIDHFGVRMRCLPSHRAEKFCQLVGVFLRRFVEPVFFAIL